MHDHGNCERCDTQEVALHAMERHLDEQIRDKTRISAEYALALQAQTERAEAWHRDSQATAKIANVYEAERDRERERADKAEILAREYKGAMLDRAGEKDAAIARIASLEQQLAESHDDICENGHATHEECGRYCSCVGSGKSRVEIAEARAEKAEGELRCIDAYLGNRPIFDGLPNRTAKILLALAVAKQVDPNGKVALALLGEA
jgi:beta-glucosidase-like glycosyl hydrolase